MDCLGCLGQVEQFQFEHRRIEREQSIGAVESKRNLGLVTPGDIVARGQQRSADRLGRGGVFPELPAASNLRLLVVEQAGVSGGDFVFAGAVDVEPVAKVRLENGRLARE